MPREWTDRASPSPYADLGLGAQVVDFEQLLALADLLEKIKSSDQGGLYK